MSAVTYPPAKGERLASFLRMIEAFERDEIERAVDLLILRLDAHDAARVAADPVGAEIAQAIRETARLEALIAAPDATPLHVTMGATMLAHWQGILAGHGVTVPGGVGHA